MKKITFYLSLLLVVMLSAITNSNAQKIGPLYGMTQKGGNGDGGGILFKYNVPQATDSIAYQFADDISVYEPEYGKLIQGPDGSFYGMTESGGASEDGAIFKYSPSGVTTILHSFIYAKNDGYEPYGSLIFGNDGNLYGMTYEGGKYDEGVIFKCTTAGKFDTLASFNGTNGEEPYGSLIQGTDGNFYGMTYDGGKYDDGVIFKCTTAGILDTLVSFNEANGEEPYGDLIQATDGNLYGMTYGGGQYNDGVIFSCTTIGVLDTLVSFNGINGEEPYGSLIQGTDGNLYGMSERGGLNYEGNVFKCTTTGIFDTIASFNETNGYEPYGSLIQGTDGNLYGMTESGGNYNDGVVFQCTTTGILDTLFSFNGTNGEEPYGSLMQASNGSLYGMTYEGGLQSDGVLFQCTTSGTETVLYNMGTYINSFYYPYGSVIEGTDGNLYGVTEEGGREDNGAIFKYNPTTGLTDTIASLTDTLGNYSYGGLMQASDGNLYGMTYAGGAYDAGTIFKCSTTGVVDTLVSFDGTTAGYAYGNNLIQATDGNLYGMTYYAGGTRGDGVIFRCSLSGVLDTLVSFDSINGSFPSGSLLQAKDGFLYGMASNGGRKNAGVIFKCSLTGIFDTLVSFDGANGSIPVGNLIQGVDGNLYGMTENGGTSNNGTIFKCTTTGQITVLYSFTGGNDGGNPSGNLIQASDSNLYGITSDDGPNGDGTMFKCTTQGIFDTLFSFNEANGEDAQYSNLLEYMSVGVTSNVLCQGDSISPNVVGGGLGTYTYKWSNNATTASLNDITAGGTYSVTVTNASGLAITQSITLPVYTLLNATASESNPKCNGSSTGTAIAVPNGGTAGYTYVWNSNPSQTTATATGLAAGNYMVTVTDINACNATASVTLIDPAVVSVATYSVINASCNGCNNGAAELIVTGGNKNTAVWSDSTAIGYVVLSGRTNDSINTVVAGTYVCTVTDSCGDSKTDTIRISQPILTGVQNVTDTKNVNVYPMPNNGHFTMALKGTGFQLLTIHDETGHEIFRQTLNDNSATVGIDLSMYADGIYFAQVITTHGVLNKKIMIQK